MALEAGLQAKTITYIKAKGGCANNIHGDEHQTGVPDVIACYKGLYIGLETKQPNGTLSPIQRAHLNKIRRAGGIGEAPRSFQIVKDIITTIDRGEVWGPMPL